MAVAHSILVCIYYVLRDKRPYTDLGAPASARPMGPLIRRAPARLVTRMRPRAAAGRSYAYATRCGRRYAGRWGHNSRARRDSIVRTCSYPACHGTADRGASLGQGRLRRLPQPFWHKPTSDAARSRDEERAREARHGARGHRPRPALFGLKRLLKRTGDEVGAYVAEVCEREVIARLGVRGVEGEATSGQP
jgi:hypothetical protein